MKKICKSEKSRKDNLKNVLPVTFSNCGKGFLNITSKSKKKEFAVKLMCLIEYYKSPN